MFYIGVKWLIYVYFLDTEDLHEINRTINLVVQHFTHYAPLSMNKRLADITPLVTVLRPLPYLGCKCFPAPPASLASR